MINDTLIHNLYSEKYKINDIKVDKIANLGFINEVYKVTFKDNCHIIRLRNENNVFNEYMKEKFCMEQAAKVGIPTASVIDVGYFNDIPYIIESFLDGINGTLCSEKSEIIWTKLGEYIRALHTVEINGYGLEMTEYGTFYNSISPTLHDHFKYNLNSIHSEDKLIQLGVYSESRINIIKKLFSSLLVMDFKIGLCHGDISAKNVLVSGNEVYLIDFGGAYAGVAPYDDFLGITGNSEKEFMTFVNAYGISTQEFNENRVLYYTFSALKSFDNVRWALDNNIPEILTYVENAKKCVDKLFY